MIGWMIELRNSRTGCPSGLAFNVRTHVWEPVSVRGNSFPTAEAAISYAQENGLVIGDDVLITSHIWD